LAEFFDLWMDNEAKSRPREFQHVYEWPMEYQNYLETVGQPEDRLWRQTLTGRGRSKVASFTFRASKRPSPVNPILSAGGVKEGVHIFTWKAMAMEYGMPITVTPKLARYLAYVDDNGNSGGRDEGYSGSNGGSVHFSKGPVHFRAGGGITFMKFTTAFVEWWGTMSQDHFHNDIAPVLAQGLLDQRAMGAAIRTGKNATKDMSITAAPAKNAQTFAEARRLGIEFVNSKTGSYINQAAARRALIYGD
jgi:hypothetical protein